MLVIGITSRALFDLDKGHEIFKKEGLGTYRDYQISHENIPLDPGQAFPLVNKLLELNKKIDGDRSVEVILLSSNSADTGLRIFNSIEHHNLDIKKIAALFDLKYYKAQSATELKLSINSANNDNCVSLIDAIIDIDDNIKENKDFLLKIDKELD